MYNGSPVRCLPIHLWYLRKPNIKHRCISKNRACLIELQTGKVLEDKQCIMQGPTGRMWLPWRQAGTGLCGAWDKRVLKQGGDTGADGVTGRAKGVRNTCAV